MWSDAAMQAGFNRTSVMTASLAAIESARAAAAAAIGRNFIGCQQMAARDGTAI